MTFLNLPILLGLTGVAIPILIHLFNRRHAKIIDWGAMRFLLSSLTSRRRRVLIEEILLMCIRCLLVALLVLAVSRPLLPVHGAVSWVVILPALLAASVCAGIGAASWAQTRARWILLSVALALVLIGVGATMIEYWWQGSRWSGKGRQDIAIVIDASTSMMLKTDGQTTTFDRAVAEARRIVKESKRGDAVSVILAGAAPRELSGTPIADKTEVLALLGDVKPMGGTMNALAALNAAVDNLSRGNRPGKKIIVLTDTQKVGWDLGGGGRWRFLAEATEEMPIKPQIICRTIESEGRIVNAAVVDVSLSRGVVGMDREVEITVQVANSGTEPTKPLPVMLQVDGAEVASEPIRDIEPGKTAAVSFMYKFSEPGPHVVAARIGIAGADQLEADDVSYRTVMVLEQLPVLIVDGGPDSGAEALATAMAPDPGGRDVKHVLKPTIVKVTDLVAVGDFSEYRLVVLADVPSLPKSTTEPLAAYVAAGGGLLIAPGREALPQFYNTWQATPDMRLTPALLGERVIDTESPALMATKTFDHPALKKAARATDVEDVLTLAHWDMSVDANEVGVSVGGRFNTGRPLLAERAVGKGYVVMMAMSFDESDGTLNASDFSVLLAHELAYYLAAPRSPRANILPAAAITLELQCPRSATTAPPSAEALAELGGSGKIEVVMPSGTHREATVAYAPGAVQLSFTETAEPGKYRFVLPEALAAKFPNRTTSNHSVPFVVYDSPDESRSDRLEKEDFLAMGRHVEISQAHSYQDVAAAIAGQIPGEELWSYLALAALALVLGEIGLTRWIERRRHLESGATVDFSGEAEKSEAFKARAKDILTGGGAET